MSVTIDGSTGIIDVQSGVVKTSELVQDNGPVGYPVTQNYNRGQAK